MAGTDPTILDQAAQWLKDGRQVALATVIETWGSAPQPVGSQLAIDGEGNFIGSVSGGCVEGAVVTEAIDVIGSGHDAWDLPADHGCESAAQGGSARHRARFRQAARGGARSCSR